MKQPPDMSRNQFSKALKAHGFRLSLFWITCPNHPSLSGESISVIATMKGKLCRRATLAKAIKHFEADQ